MYTLGHSFIPAPVHAGGLRYHGMAPIVSALYDQGLIECVSVSQNPVFEAAVTFARAEGIIPAPEAAHGIRAVIDEALEAKAAGQTKVIAVNLSGHGHFDMAAYDDFLARKLPDVEYSQEEVERALAEVPAPA
jgi:tryptophan synthase beta chain